MARIANYFVRSDILVYNLFNQKIHCMLLDMVMRGITHFGSTGFAIILPITLLFTQSEFLNQIALGVIASLILSQIIVHSIKRFVNRRRPYEVIKSAIAINPPNCKYSFPSGHTCAAFAIAFPLCASIPQLAVLFITLATLVGVSRIYLGFHYPTDVVVGFLIAYVSWIINVNLVLQYIS